MQARTAVPAFRAGAVVSVRGVVSGVRRALGAPLLAGLAFVLFAGAGCAMNGPGDAAPPDRAGPTNEGAVVDSVSIEDELAEHTDAWMEIEGVEGTGIGLCDDAPCIKVFVSRPPDEFEDVLPESVHGHPVRLEPTGRFEAQ